jgi:hypothetical protein
MGRRLLEDFVVDSVAAHPISRADPEDLCVINHRSRRVMEKAGFIYEREFEHGGAPHVLYRRYLTGAGRRPAYR